MKMPSVSVTSGGVSAACAIVTLGMAVIAGMRASQADHLLEQAKRAADAAKIEADAAKSAASSAKEQLAEMRRGNAIGRDQVAETTRNADATSRGADAIKDEVVVLREQRKINDRVARTAADELRAVQSANADAASSRLFFAGVAVTVLEAGKPTHADIYWRKEGHTPLTHVQVWSSMAWSPRPTRQVAPACGPLFDDTAEPARGIFGTTAKTPASAEKFNTDGTLKEGLLVWGAVCYEDVNRKPHRSDYCSFIKSPSEINLCPGVPDPL